MGDTEAAAHHVLDADEVVVDEEQVGPPLLNALFLKRWGPVGAVGHVANQTRAHRQHEHVGGADPEQGVTYNWG